MRYYYKNNKGSLFNFKSEHFVKYKEVTETTTLTDENGNPFLDENGEPITQTVTKTVRDGLEDGYTQITEEEFNELSNKRYEPTEEQKAKIEKARRIAELKKKLADTDYIVLKIAEATFKGDELEVEKLNITYSTQLSDRIVWRQKINELEG